MMSDKKEEQKVEVKELIKEAVKIVKKDEKKKNYVIPKVGLRNRTIYPIHVIFEDSDTLLQPSQVTNKVYLESEIKTVQGMPLVNAISKGLITLVR